jgi:hypothetical protein
MAAAAPSAIAARFTPLRVAFDPPRLPPREVVELEVRPPDEERFAPERLPPERFPPELFDEDFFDDFFAPPVEREELRLAEPVERPPVDLRLLFDDPPRELVPPEVRPFDEPAELRDAFERELFDDFDPPVERDEAPRPEVLRVPVERELPPDDLRDPPDVLRAVVLRELLFEPVAFELPPRLDLLLPPRDEVPRLEALLFEPPLLLRDVDAAPFEEPVERELLLEPPRDDPLFEPLLFDEVPFEELLFEDVPFEELLFEDVPFEELLFEDVLFDPPFALPRDEPAELAERFEEELLPDEVLLPDDERALREPPFDDPREPPFDPPRFDDVLPDELPEELPELLEPLSETESRLTNLLKRLSSSSERRTASLFSSKASKNSSHSISSSVSSPLKPGKSMRRIPGSLPLPVLFTRAGFPPRASTHRWISSRSVVGCALAMFPPDVDRTKTFASREPESA